MPAKSSKSATAKPVLLSGENPQIPKGDGDAPVQAYLDAIPGWKQDAARKLDALIVKTVPGVKKAVRWNTPFYGVGDGYFMGFHMFTRYIKITFIRGKSLTPVPPEPSKDPDAAYFHIYEDQPVDEKQLASWITQASRLPGWDPREPSKPSTPSAGKQKSDTVPLTASQEIDAQIAAMTDWRGEMLAKLRELIHAADPQVLETVKWRKPSNNMRGVPVFEHGGIIGTLETYKQYIKFTFNKGASLPDPDGIFNAGLNGGTRRAIDFHEGAKINSRAFKALIKAAVKANVS